jgi:hypothetical protein
VLADQFPKGSPVLFGSLCGIGDVAMLGEQEGFNISALETGLCLANVKMSSYSKMPRWVLM